MKILEFCTRILKNHENHRISLQNHETNQNHKII